MKKQLIFFFLFLFVFATPVMARSYHIDEAQIRTWIKPSGNVVINEIFHYTFDGKYNHVIRSIHTDGHEGIQNFTAYELKNASAEPGFVQQEDLQPLTATQDGSTYRVDLPSENETRSVLFTYELLNAVRSYDTYSDLTIPFFGTDENHDETIQNVTIDVVFPEPIQPSQYYAFMHDRFGSVEEKGEEVVRFETPESPLYSLTEVRVLFPSSIMKMTEKSAAPATLTETVEEENMLAQAFYKKEDQKQQLTTILKVLSATSIAGILAVFLLRFRGRSPGTFSSLLDHDPLYLYMIDRNGKADEYAFLAGLYSLVEKGIASVQTIQSGGRFKKDPDAPDETLRFRLNSRETAASCDQKLIELLFKNQSVFTIQSLAGSTKREKESKTGRNFHSKVRYYQERQQEWVECAMEEMKNQGFFSAFIPSLLKKLMLFSVFTFILYAYKADSLAVSTSIVYGTISAVLLLAIWRKPKKRWPAFLFYIVSLFAVTMLYDMNTADWLFVFILLNALLYTLMPRFLLSSEAAAIKSAIKNFKKQELASERDLEKWMIRSLLLKAERPDAKTTTAPAMAATAPLAYLILTDQEPIRYVARTWRWSAPPRYSSSSKNNWGSHSFSSDSGGSGGDGGGGSGGDGGGGAGAD
ncbi:DUF2207 domain-containing protein [Domibacillus indicus]|uniref:DUF2207 domain-containing protein n=1 Tax=Domibacillus indicus TaxID=1437523 RepID=UPI000617BEFF|nr:DUF2207 domain-containing protein [Domibacillus indicus]